MNDHIGKNYFTDGGDTLVIGGDLKLERGSAGVIPNVTTPASDANATAVRTSLIGLIKAMKDGGLIAGDTFTLTYGAVPSDAESNRAYNTGKISSVAIEDNVITITLSEKVSALKDFDGRNGWGVHKWLGIGISAGVSPITGLYYNGSALTADDVTEASNVGLSTGYFVRWVAADLVLAHDNSQKSIDTFKLWSSGYAETAFTLKIVEPA